MFVLILFIALIMSATVVMYITRPVPGYYSEYYIPTRNNKGVTIRFAPIRVAMVALLLVSSCGFLVTLLEIVTPF